MSIRKYTESEALNLQLGQAGWDIVSNATVNAHTYVAITVLVGTEVIADNSASGTVSAITWSEIIPGATMTWTPITSC
jgi:hypothetical protein